MNVRKNHDYCYKQMPKEGKILKHNHVEKSTKFQFITCAFI